MYILYAQTGILPGVIIPVFIEFTGSRLNMQGPPIYSNTETESIVTYQLYT